MIFKLGELFCGPGGIGYAAKTAQIANNQFAICHAWANDFDKDTCKTFAHNTAKHPQTVICKDIRELDFEKLREISEIDALAFGFPCNDFSIVGEKKGINGTFGPLYRYGVEALKKFQPQWFFAENVGGLKNSNDGDTFNTILQEMSEAGYSVYPHLYKFEKYGVPQARHRIIIVGIRDDIDITFRVPSTEDFIDKTQTAKQAIESPPIKKDADNHVYTKQSETVIERLKYIKPGENAFTANIPQELQLNVKGAKISQIYKRLHPDKPAYTITGSGGGGTHVYHWKENRALTNRERARLQTFPDDFIFHGSKESVRKQIGMAVPVAGARVIFEAIMKSFAGEEYKFVNCSFPPIIRPLTKKPIKSERINEKDSKQLMKQKTLI